MEAALVSVSTGVMKPLLYKLTKLLADEYVKLKGVRKQIKFLIDELSAMSATLEMLADEEHLNPEMKVWRDNLREMAYDIEDCVDAFMARGDHDGSKGFRGFVRKMKNLKVRHKIGNEIEELKRRVTEASERHKKYNFVPSAHNTSTSFVDPRLSALYEDIKNLVAIDGPKKDIIDLLKMEPDSSTEVQVVSIYGCGGLGKTTLANQVYHSIKSEFSCSAFVSVSQNPDMTKILRDIAKGVGITDSTMDDVPQLISKLRDYLHNKRYFIVIDDIWDEKHWEHIWLALSNNDCGSRLITTTRSVTVAKKSSSQGGSVYKLNHLSLGDSKRLLFKRAFGSENSDYSYLGDAPDRILRKCDGLPLAIITVASMLTEQHAKEKWAGILSAIGFKLAKRSDAERMTSILSLSYTSMPHHLRTCLLYLSLFPEDYIIRKQRLINRWIAEGFIQKEDEQSAYETGETYFNELINRCMIQPVRVEYEQAKACRVHDIILDYIKCKAVEENFVASLDDLKNVYTSEYKARRLCVSNHNGKKDTICAGLTLSHIRSLAIFGKLPVQTYLEPFKVLRVLDLGDCEKIEDCHLASIGKLFHLKYLHLGSGSITKLPEKIGELQYLQTLDVQHTGIRELPLNITKLQQLSHLYVNWGVKFSDGMIGQMRSLEELSNYEIKSYEQGMALQEFSNLTKLRTLNIRWNFDYLDESEGIRQSEEIWSYMVLLSSCNLHNLSIWDSSTTNFPLQLDSWHPSDPCSLRKLCFEFCFIVKVPNWMGSLGNLQVLKLVILCVRPEDVEILGAIPSLLFLELGTFGGTNGRICVQGCNGFRSLKYLYLEIGCCGTALEFEAGSMPKLEHVKLLFRVHRVGCLNGSPSFGIQALSALRKVEVTISGDCTNYDPVTDTNDGIVRCVAKAINATVETHPNRPTLSFETESDYDCYQFECFLRRYNKRVRGALTEWLKIWHIEEERTGKQCYCLCCADEEEEQTKTETDEEDEEDDTDEMEEKKQQEDYAQQ